MQETKNAKTIGHSIPIEFRYIPIILNLTINLQINIRVAIVHFLTNSQYFCVFVAWRVAVSSRNPPEGKFSVFVPVFGRLAAPFPNFSRIRAASPFLP